MQKALLFYTNYKKDCRRGLNTIFYKIKDSRTVTLYNNRKDKHQILKIRMDWMIHPWDFRLKNLWDGYNSHSCRFNTSTVSNTQIFSQVIWTSSTDATDLVIYSKFTKFN